MFKKIKEQLDEIDSSASVEKDVEMKIENLQIGDGTHDSNTEMTDEQKRQA